MTESTQKKLSRVRPPRVQITYDVETGGAIEKKELPLVVGILADLAGKPENPLPPMKFRKFVDIDRDNFNDVMKSIAPCLDFSVSNVLAKDTNSSIKVVFKPTTLDDFRPEGLIKQVEALKKLQEERTRLNDLLAKLDGNDDLDKQLQAIVSSTETQQKIKDATDGGQNNG